MRSALLAEWLIARTKNKQQARSIVGDLVELKPQRGPAWFWLSIIRIFIAMAWRPAVAWIAGFYTCAWTFSAFEMAIHGMYAKHRPPNIWSQVFDVLSGAGALLCLLLGYSVIRYGLRDKLTQLALVLASVAVGIIYLWWQPVLLSLCISLGICCLGISAANREYRKAAIIVAATTIFGFFGALLFLFLATEYQHLIDPGPLGDKELRAHPSISWVYFALMFTLTWCVTYMCAHMHHSLMQKKRMDPEVEC